MKKNYLLLIIMLITGLSYGQSPGDIIITEVMQNPAAVDDTLGEYFEVYNTTGSSIDMNGWTVSDAGTNSFVIGSSVIVAAGGYAVFGVNADMATNGNVPVDYVFATTSMALANSDDEIILTTASAVEIDRIEWDGGPIWPDPTGASMNLDSGKLNSIDNNDGANWCESTTLISGGPGTDTGTPGAANESCGCDLRIEAVNRICETQTAGATNDTYSVEVDFTGGATGGVATYNITTTAGTIGGDSPDSVVNGTIIISGIVEGTDITVTVDNLGVGGTCNYSEGITSPVCHPSTCMPVGSVIINEVMQNPAIVADAVGEWFELYNTTGSAIDLEGWNIYDDSNPANEGFTIEQSLIIPANGYLLFAVDQDPLVNGGLPTLDYVYTYDLPGLTLGNGLDGLTVRCSGTIIDSIVWDGGIVWPDPSGASMSLDVSFNNAIDNDDGVNWAAATFTYGDGDLGTPGGVNNVQLSVEKNEIDGFSMYPNPVTDGFLTIHSANSIEKSIFIYDILGRQVLSKSVRNNEKINVSTLNTGIYILKVEEEGKLATRRIIIQ